MDAIVAGLQQLGTRTAAECVSAVAAHDVKPTFPPLGRLTAREARDLFEHRLQTATLGGRSTLGFEETLAALRTLHDDETVLLAGFSGPQRTFVAFMSESSRIIGCVGVAGPADGAGTIEGRD